MKNLQFLLLAIARVLFTAFGLCAGLSAQTLNDNGSTHTINANGASQYQGSAQDYTIPSNTTYNSISFTLRGGDGGYAKAGTACQSNGGAGASTEAEFFIGNGTNELKPGGTIRFIVGKHGENGSVGGTDGVGGGGGGGTAILYRPSNNASWIILATAGGGGGAYQGNFLGNCIDNQKGQGGRSTENGGNGEGSSYGSGGTNGNGGSGGGTGLSGGGGGANSSGGNAGGGTGFPNGGNGATTDQDGGWGFGGGGWGGDGGKGGGGGGGYSGGGGGGAVDNGGGGGSYVNSSFAFSSTKTAGSLGGGNSLNGYVDYTFKNVIITWTGAVSHDWHLKSNWSPARVPQSVDVVEIYAATNSTYIWHYSPANAKTVRVLSGGELTLQPNATLNLYPLNSNGISNYGTITNDAGAINISPVGGTNNDGIVNSGGSFINKFAGEINIESMDRYGIWNKSNGTFTNQNGGTTDIGTASNQIGNHGIQNDSGCSFINSGFLNIRNTNAQGINTSGAFNNTTNGLVKINQTTGDGIQCNGGSFANNGAIEIGFIAAIGDDGIENQSSSTFTNSGTLTVRNTIDIGISSNATFTNNVNGNILIEQTGTWGLIHWTGTFNNAGTISIDLLTNPLRDGLQNRSAFNNYSSGIIIIDQVGRHGIYNWNGTFANEGLIKIGENGSIGNRAIYNEGGPNPVFLNNGCGAAIHIFSEEIVDASNAFTNSGIILQESAGSSNIETNDGIILYNAGSFTADNGNAPVSVSGSFSGKKIWTGCDGIAWEPPVNWYPGGTPTTSDEVFVYPIGTDPHINTSAETKSVRVSDGARLVNDGSLAVADGDFVIDPGATVEGNGQYALSGHFSVNGGTFLAGTSTVTMSGTADLKAIGNDFISFYSLVIDKPSNITVVINSPVVVTNNLTINSGDLTVNGSLTCPFLHLPNGSDLTNAGNIVQFEGASSFWIQSGASAQGNGFYYVSGDFIVDGGTFATGTSVVTLNGTANQTISQDPINFYTLVIDKPSGTASLGAGPVTVSNEMYLFSGNFDLNGADLELIGNGTIIGENPASYIYSTNGGVVKKTVDLNAPASENPGNIGVSITSAANLGSTTIQRGHVAQDVHGQLSILRYYDISPANNSGLDATVRFSYFDHELNGNVESNLVPYRFNGTDWDEYLVSASDASANWVETVNVNAFSKWTLACNLEIYYADTDGDGYGDPAAPSFLCTPQTGYVTDNTDCNDTDPNVNPNPDCSTTTRTWTGHVSSDWNEACNWSPNCVPTASKDVVIPDVANDPIIANGTTIVVKSMVIEDGGVMTNNGHLTMDNGDIWIKPGAELQGDGTYIVKGDWINDGSFAAGSSFVGMRGTVQIRGASPTFFYKLSAFASNTTLAVPTTVFHILYMTLGTLNLNGHDLTLFSTATIQGETDLSYIFSTNGGVVRITKFLNAPSADNPGNIGVTITSAANLGLTTIQRGHEVQIVNGEMSILRYYDISPANNSGLDATVRFSYLDHELNGNGESDLDAYRFDGTDWNLYPASASNAADNWVETENVDAFSKWTLASGCTAATFFADADGDGYGNPFVSVVECSAPSGYVTDNTDCNDTDPNVNPNPDCTTTTRTWTGHINSDWEEACNWSPNCVPTANDDVVIPDVVNDPVISGTTVAVAQSVTITVNGAMTINGNGSLTINTSSPAGLLNNGVVYNDGVMNITGGTRGILNKSALINNAGATINITNHSNSCLTLDNASTIITNHGTINCYGTAKFGLANTFGLLTNHATGIINMLGSFQDYAMLKFESDLVNQGEILIDGTLGAGIYFTGSSASFNNSGTFIVENVGEDAFIISPSAPFTNTGIFQGEGTYKLFGHPLDGTVAPGNSHGIMNYLGDQTFETTGTLVMEIEGTIPGTEHDQIIVEGTATIGGTLNMSINYNPTKGDRIVLLTATTITGTFSSISPVLPYDWYIDYSVLGEVALVYDYTLGVWDGAAGDDEWTNHLNWQGRVLPGPSNVAIISNGDAVTLSSGTQTVLRIETSGGSDLVVSAGAQLNVLTGSNGSTAINATCGGCSITNYGTIIVDGGNKGYNSAGGSLINHAGALMQFTNQSQYGISTIGGARHNYGIITIDGAGVHSMTIGGDFTNHAGANIQITNSGTGNAIVPSNNFTNDGTITINGSQGKGVFTYNQSFVNTGVLSITGTTGPALERAGGSMTHSGILKGTGTIKLNGSNIGGTISPGNSPGTMTFTGSQNFDATSTLEIEVNGTTPGTEHDQIIVDNTTTIGGTLNVSINYAPVSNDRIVILSATTVSGTFSNITPPLPSDWAVNYSVPGEVALQYSGILPVELVHFHASKAGDGVLLTWETASETNNEGFEVEYSTDGRNWEYLGFVDGHGTSTEAHAYSFTHGTPSHGMNYYRLRQVDFDGNFEYSNIRSVEFENLDSQIKIFPNPASTLSSVQLPGDFEQASIMAFDASGRVVFSQKLEGGQPLQTIDVSGWGSGLYLLRIEVDGKSTAQKLQVSTD